MGELISLYLSLHGEAGHFTDPLLNWQNARMKYKIIDIRTSAVTKSILIVISKDIFCILNNIQPFWTDAKFRDISYDVFIETVDKRQSCMKVKI